jgi:hypothetical protein
MAVTLDGKTLTIEEGSFREVVRSVNVAWDAWENEAFTRKVKVLGSIRGWTFRCHENESVTWTNSAAKYLQSKVGTDAAVNFTVSKGNLHSVNTDVYILIVDVSYEQKDRYFTITLQEV